MLTYQRDRTLAIAWVISFCLAKAGILRKSGVDIFSRCAGVLGGVLYMITFEVKRSISPVVDFVAVLGAGIVVGGILYGVFLMAAGFATDEDK